MEICITNCNSFVYIFVCSSREYIWSDPLLTFVCWAYSLVHFKIVRKISNVTKGFVCWMRYDIEQLNNDRTWDNTKANILVKPFKIQTHYSLFLGHVDQFWNIKWTFLKIWYDLNYCHVNCNIPDCLQDCRLTPQTNTSLFSMLCPHSHAYRETSR
jgi:hypothetical protein